jgi:integrase
MTITPPSRTADSAPPTLAELLERIASEASLTQRRRQETCSALRTVGRAIGRRLEEIPANPRQLRERLVPLTPAMVGVSPGRWANIVSLVRGALKLAGLTAIPGRSTEPLAPEWLALFRHLNDRRLREGLSRFARYCGRLGITPSEVNEAIATSFLAALENDGLIRNPRQVHRTMCVAWNRAAQIIAAWPPSGLSVPQYRQTYSLPWEVFPSSLRNEIGRYFERLSGKDLLAELDFRPLRAASINSYHQLLRAFLSALVRRGRDPQSFQSLADVVGVETVKDGLRFFLERAGGDKTKQTYNIARMLTAMARYWVKVDKDHLDQLRAICRRLDGGKAGMTPKNRARLRQFDDQGNVDSLVTLPQRVLARQNRRTDPTRADALQVQSALMIELLLLVPARIGNLACLDIERHIVRTRAGGKGAVHLVVPEEEVKNGVAINAKLSPDTVRLLDIYLERYRPLLLERPSSWLFPNRSGGPKSRHTLALQICKFVRSQCGLTINPHLFRHIGAKFYLEAHPGAYGVIQLVLGHRSYDTTIRAYCGTENAAAMRHFDEHVLHLRAQASPVRERKRRRAR